MTEAEWLTDDQSMLLRRSFGTFRGGEERELRLLTRACMRKVWDLLSDQCRQVFELVECYWDGQATRGDVGKVAPAHSEAQRAMREFARKNHGNEIRWAVGDIFMLAFAIQHALPQFDNMSSIPDRNYLPKPAGKRTNNDLVRDIFGNPFRPSEIYPSWLTWNRGASARLALTIEADRAFDLLPILADALEEAGCTDQQILSHCRGSGPHVRGCWVVDALLGRERRGFCSAWRKQMFEKHRCLKSGEAIIRLLEQAEESETTNE